jgi:hypothetical protein
MKSVIIKDAQGRIIVHIRRNRANNGYESRILKELDGKVQITVIDDKNKRVILR